MDVSKLFANTKIVAADAAMVIEKADFYVKQIEASAGTGISGAQKLDAVKAALVADLKVFAPTIASGFETLWPPLTAIISGLVALYNAAQLFGFFRGQPRPASAAAIAAD